jgi:hypothetical protein
MDIHITSVIDPEYMFSLEEIKNYLYNPNEINKSEFIDNNNRIENLNRFLKNDLDKIETILNEENYFTTKADIENLFKFARADL